MTEPVHGDWHLTAADKVAGERAKSGLSPQPGTEDSGDFYLTDADREAQKKATEELLEDHGTVVDKHTKPELIALANDNNIDASGTKDEIAARLIEAGKL